MRLSDSIESFIKTLITQEEPEVELKRNELAEYFGCASVLAMPSASQRPCASSIS